MFFCIALKIRKRIPFYFGIEWNVGSLSQSIIIAPLKNYEASYWALYFELIFEMTQNIFFWWDLYVGFLQIKKNLRWIVEVIAACRIGRIARILFVLSHYMKKTVPRKNINLYPRLYSPTHPSSTSLQFPLNDNRARTFASVTSFARAMRTA